MISNFRKLSRIKQFIDELKKNFSEGFQQNTRGFRNWNCLRQDL